MFQKAAKYFFMENNLEMAGLSYLEEGKCYLKLNKLPQALEAFKTALTTFEDINISSIRKGLNLSLARTGICFLGGSRNKSHLWIIIHEYD